MFLSVLFLLILTCAEIDLMVPSFPQMQKVFGLSEFQVEWLLGINLVAQALAGLLVGVLGDRYGRKPILMLGLVGFLIGTAMCLWALNYPMLLVGRLLQGIGVAGPAILAYLVVADAYPVQEQQQRMGVLNGTVTLSMAFAPTLGSYINLWTSWQGNFAFLGVFALVALALSFLFIPKGVANIEHKASLSSYWPVVKNRSVWWYVAVFGALCSPYWIFIGIAPMLYMESWGVSLNHFGWYQGAMAGTFAVVSFSSGFFLRRFGERRCLQFSIILLCAFVLLCLGLVFFKIQNPLWVTLVGVIQAIGIIFPINILWPMSLGVLPNSKGCVTAVVGGSRLVISALGVQVASYFYDGTFLAIGICMVLGIGVSVVLLLGYLQRSNAKAS